MAIIYPLLLFNTEKMAYPVKVGQNYELLKESCPIDICKLMAR
jgi:hypothetical protein